jgi:hypothetical protein
MLFDIPPFTEGVAPKRQHFWYTRCRITAGGGVIQDEIIVRRHQCEDVVVFGAVLPN